jgi:streptogramin lyase
MLTACIGITGCGVGTNPVVSGEAVLQGRIYGGQQAINGADVVLYAAGTVGNGVSAVNLIAPNVITTKADGSFSLKGDFTCPTDRTQVYLVARGGNPGFPSGKSNAAIVLVAALGDCDGLTSSSRIILNEATTVAAVWALAPFLGMAADVGSSATNATGLRNAFGISANLVDTTTGGAPGLALPTTAVAETTKLNTLANALASCVNSDGGLGCQPLFDAATVGGIVPTNTLEAALSIVRNPGMQVGEVFSVSTPQGPFQPMLPRVPNDWTMSITYGNCISGCGGLNTPGSIAIDSTGNVWVANYFGGVVSKFSAAGVAAAAQGFPGVGLEQSYGIAIDTSDNAWVTNENSVTAANNRHSGSVSKFSPAGAELSGTGFTVGGIYFPQAIASDASGNMWIANHSNSSATLLANSGAAISGANGYALSQLPFTTAVAIDGSNNALFAVQKAVAQVTPLGVVSNFSCCNTPSGVAVDQAGNIWLADYAGSSIVEVSSAGAVVNRISTVAGATAPQGIAVDGAGNIWTANYFGNSVSEIAGSTASFVSPAAGMGRDAPLNEPYGIAVDASGSVWVSNAGGETLTQFIGLAAPVRTPLLGPPVQP